jgi:ABC-type transport system involved in multi-copper enzyme maturation permease subunit
MDNNATCLLVILVVVLALAVPLLVYVCWNFVMPVLGVAVLPTIWHSYVLCFLVTLLGGYACGSRCVNSSK